MVAEATARELGRISLAEALELTILIAPRLWDRSKERLGTDRSLAATLQPCRSRARGPVGQHLPPVLDVL
jgi:hypothetical protein